MMLYTAGHSTVDLEVFVGLIREHDIDLVADVRSKPRSRLPHFDQNPLETALEDAVTRYRYLGDKLGGMPHDPRVAERWRQGRLDPLIVDHLRKTDEWQDGLDELSRLITSRGGTSVCIICSEGDPNECHRKAVALDVAQLIPDLEIVHLAVNKTAPREVGLQEVLV